MTTRLAALAKALEAGSGRFFDPSVTEARTVLQRAGDRMELSLDHTVVALAGSTGGGKSSLFNVISGIDVARVGVRRPTTSQPLACVWRAEGAEALLDWLEVPERNRVAKESALDSGANDELDGLILLDLPDHDSTEAEHRQTVDRMVELVDLFVWVMDPQKYADAAIHDRYLRSLEPHSDVTLIVLNQIDRLDPDDAQACAEDLRQLLDDDGLSAAPLLPVSAATGEGIDALLRILRDVVAKRRAAGERIEADTRRVAGRMVSALASRDAGVVDEATRIELIDAMAQAAGVEELSATVGRAYLRPRAEPPRPAPVERATVESAVRDVGPLAAGSLSGGWGGSFRAIADEAAARAPDALDDALRAVDLGSNRGGFWWRLSGVVQWFGLVAGLLGGLWALARRIEERFEIGWGQLPQLDVAGFPLSIVLFVCGGAVGLVLVGVRLAHARRARAARAVQAEERLREVIADVADEVVVDPLRAELDQYHTFREALEEAAA
ncbi:ABC transporter [Actinobacteria bacterium YIM 96077]|uniref:ABC transporter n=1 Tax=Phytoactinopolyspora halophila TaxID=1981511 RepID=A0A329QNB4_9ACTN|nr:GTPase [Phytoactinopolyspora halophila]AYY12252.1 ABC transporter [Actinobacteria bacterium YIM 96077]RAW13830.1 ABC transporter [Phytoactinopolyspora halophila]